MDRENPATRYKSGDLLNVDFSISEHGSSIKIKAITSVRERNAVASSGVLVGWVVKLK